MMSILGTAYYVDFSEIFVAINNTYISNKICLKFKAQHFCALLKIGLFLPRRDLHVHVYTHTPLLWKIKYVIYCPKKYPYMHVSSLLCDVSCKSHCYFEICIFDRGSSDFLPNFTKILLWFSFNFSMCKYLVRYQHQIKVHL